MPRKICFCFNYSDADILDDLKKNGFSTILKTITQAKKDGACDCKDKNPAGT